jgi:hypothetical protein
LVDYDGVSFSIDRQIDCIEEHLYTTVLDNRQGNPCAPKESFVRLCGEYLPCDNILLFFAAGQFFVFLKKN